MEGDTVAPGCGWLPGAAPENRVRKQVLALLFRGALLSWPIPEDKRGAWETQRYLD